MHTAARIFEKFCYENKDALSAGIIVAGWDKDVGASVYNIPLGGGLFRQPWAIGGMFYFHFSEVDSNNSQKDPDQPMFTVIVMLHTRKAGGKRKL